MPITTARGANLQPQVLDDSDYYLTRKGNVRCNAYRKDGTRCKHWATQGKKFCTKHGGWHCLTGNPRVDYGQFIKSRKLKDHYDLEKNNPEMKSLKDELALMRMFTSACVAKIPDISDLADLTVEDMCRVSVFVKDTTAILQAMTALEHRLSVTITATDLQVVLNQVLEVITKHIDDEALLTNIANDLESVMLYARGNRDSESDNAGSETGVTQ